MGPLGRYRARSAAVVFGAASAFGAAFVVGVLAAPAPCFADPWRRPTEPATADAEREAQELYRRGVVSVEGGEPDLGIELFGLSYEKSGAALPLFAIAVTLHSTKEYVRAYGALRQLLREHADLPPDLKQKAEALYADVKARVAVLVVSGLPDRGEVTLEVDGRPVPDPGERPLHASVIPGETVLSGERADGDLFRWRGTAPAGAETAVRARWAGRFAELGPATPSPVVMQPVPGGAPTSRGDSEGASVFERPWFWVGAGVVVAAAVVTAVLIASAGDDPLTPRGDKVLRP